MQSRASRSWQQWRNNRELAPFLPVVEAIGEREEALSDLGDGDLRIAFDELRQTSVSNVSLERLEVDVFAAVREAARRTLSQRTYDVQLLAAIAMARGYLVEMATGEGKTLCAAHAACLLALGAEGVHVLTVNDYLARRDAAWMRPIYQLLGVTVGHVEASMSSASRRAAYACDVTYVTAKEAGFDRLRDGLVLVAAERVQRRLNTAIVDEADSILIDEARIPLVLAGRMHTEGIDASEIAEVIRGLEEGSHYEVDENARNVHLNEAGIEFIQTRLRVDDLYNTASVAVLADVHNALHAEALLERDVDYIVRDDRVELVDALTGRVADDRLWPEGLQGAIEAKEGVHQRPEGRILDSITMQHFIRQYDRLCGMTATARSAAEELEEFYDLVVVAIPSHRPCIRNDLPDLVFGSLESKREAVLAEVAEKHAQGRPVLVGTESIAESERLANRLRDLGIRCAVLNAKNDEREAAIVAEAGLHGAVTISTNMAGRGTDIRLGGADEEDHARVVSLGGLHVIGTNRHESQRIDDQLRGRAGRQGDPGSSRLLVSLEDALVQRFGLVSLGEVPAKTPRVGREIARAQRIVEGQNFEIRKTLYQYSVMIDRQRRLLRSWREAILAGDPDQDFLAQECPERNTQLRNELGSNALREIQDEVVLRTMDLCWSDHLDRVGDIRRGIHLVHLAGRPPLHAFLQQASDAFEGLIETIEQDSMRIFETLSIGPEGVDWEQVGLSSPSSTWTYTINDERIQSNLVRDLAYNPILLLGAPWMIPLLFVYGIWKRLKLSRRGRA